MMNPHGISATLRWLWLAGLVLVACGPQPQTERQDRSADALVAEVEAAVMAAGKAIVQDAFATLSGRLKAAMEAEGVPGAIAYCNTAAYPLTDSLAKAMAVSLRRTTLQPRNAANTPDTTERAILSQMAAQSPPQPQVVPGPDGRYTYYHPIMTQAACLACHGVPGETLKPADLAFIQQRYPADQATGYAEGDFRGMWRVDFAEWPSPAPE